LDGDTARLGRGKPLDRDLNNTIAVLRINAVRVGVIGQGQDPSEVASEALVDVHSGSVTAARAASIRKV
jgi:hypothetical protein